MIFGNRCFDKDDRAEGRKCEASGRETKKEEYLSPGLQQA